MYIRKRKIPSRKYSAHLSAWLIGSGHRGVYHVRGGLPILKEYELGAWFGDDAGNLYVAPAEAK